MREEEMIKDHWGRPVHVEFTWACRDENHAATDSCLSFRIGDEFAKDRATARFYEDDLPSLRRFVALLLGQMEIQERGAIGHGKWTAEDLAWVRDEMGRLQDTWDDATAAAERKEK